MIEISYLTLNDKTAVPSEEFLSRIEEALSEYNVTAKFSVPQVKILEISAPYVDLLGDVRIGKTGAFEADRAIIKAPIPTKSEVSMPPYPGIPAMLIVSGIFVPNVSDFVNMVIDFVGLDKNSEDDVRTALLIGSLLGIIPPSMLSAYDGTQESLQEMVHAVYNSKEDDKTWFKVRNDMMVIIGEIIYIDADYYTALPIEVAPAEKSGNGEKAPAEAVQ